MGIPIPSRFHVEGLCLRPNFQGISPQNMARNMVQYSTSINWILKISHGYDEPVESRLSSPEFQQAKHHHSMDLCEFLNIFSKQQKWKKAINFEHILSGNST